MSDFRAQVHIVSTSNAADRGFLALADFAAARLPEDSYRVIGGHMVQLLQHVYPLDGWQLRGTADADAGMEPRALVAGGQQLHQHMLGLGYELEKGNRYSKSLIQGRLDVDILVPSFDGNHHCTEIGGRGFDSIPGLHLAIAANAVIVQATVVSTSGETIEFTVPIPDVETAVVLKALAWRSRYADKDVTDLATLFEIVHQHRERIQIWRLADSGIAGARKDAVTALHLLTAAVDRRQCMRAFSGSATPARFSALVRRYLNG